MYCKPQIVENADSDKPQTTEVCVCVGGDETMTGTSWKTSEEILQSDT